MTHTIENEILTLTVSEHGAELYDLRRKAAPEAPLLWDGKPEYWARRAPLLFPWCAKMAGGWFEAEGRRYDAPQQHGFMRDVDYVLVSRTDHSLTLRYDYPGDQPFWPWPFTFEVTHALEGALVVTTCVGTNRGDSPMPAQLGFHTALRWPFTPGRAMEDYFLRFEQSESPSGGDIFPLYPHLFEKERPWLPQGLASRWIQLEEKGTGNYLRIDTAGFPYVLLWSADGAPDFLCIEPWMGFYGDSHDPFQRPAAVSLAPGASLTAVQRLTVGIR